MRDAPKPSQENQNRSCIRRGGARSIETPSEAAKPDPVNTRQDGTRSIEIPSDVAQPDPVNARRDDFEACCPTTESFARQFARHHWIQGYRLFSGRPRCGDVRSIEIPSEAAKPDPVNARQDGFEARCPATESFAGQFATHHWIQGSKLF